MTTAPEAGMRLALVRARYHVERSPCSDRDEVLSAIDEALAARAQPHGGEVVAWAGTAFEQVSTTVTVTALGDETLGDLRGAVAPLVPGFRFAGGMERIRKCEPRLLGEGVYDRDQQAHVCFVRHEPRHRLYAHPTEPAARDGGEAQ